MWKSFVKRGFPQPDEARKELKEKCKVYETV